ncbi:hypothetical protein [Streptomyces sp. NRRL S-118]|uniref:hypothetical protein n=1 Tax=Streptomyces sp. NRRL S-118 TaxID=1463881 RepID=UPI0004C7B7CE|nr:hypothetical protein [Streptomyces sp. NRRL S-118]
MPSRRALLRIATALAATARARRDGAAIDLTRHRAAASASTGDPSVQVLSTGSALRLRITPGTLGAVHQAVVRLG